jgi:hypothetical protein
MNEMMPVIQVDMLYQIEKGKAFFDKEQMLRDFSAEMERVIAVFCEEDNLTYMNPEPSITNP